MMKSDDFIMFHHVSSCFIMFHHFVSRHNLVGKFSIFIQKGGVTLCIWAAILAANLDQLGNRHFTFGKRMPKTIAMKAMKKVKKK